MNKNRIVHFDREGSSFMVVEQDMKLNKIRVLERNQQIKKSKMSNPIETLAMSVNTLPFIS